MKKKLLVAVLAILMLGAFAACSITQVSAMAFSVAPASYYTLKQNVPADQFTVQVDMEDGTTREFALTNSLLTVQGLVDGKLDTSTAGQKTLRISYRGFSFTFTYTVLDPDAETQTWADFTEGVTVDLTTNDVEVKTPQQLAAFMVACNALSSPYTGKLTLTANIDLGAHQWVPIENFAGKFDGANYTISNLNIVENVDRDSSKSNDGYGLFGNVVHANGTASFKNVTLDGFYMEQTNSQAMYSKNYGALIGAIKSTITVSVENIRVINASMKGTARIGGIVGYIFNDQQSTVTISNCYVQGSFSSINPVTVSTADGEGDKVGGIVGQANGKSQTITDCTVLVQLAGTRDIGGIVGFTGGKGCTITGCKVLSGSKLEASVPGGMLIGKGSRNVGGILGSVETSVTFEAGNEVAADVELNINDLYDYSNSGRLLGGFRFAGCAQVGDLYYCLIPETENTDYPIANADAEGTIGTTTKPGSMWSTQKNVVKYGTDDTPVEKIIEQFLQEQARVTSAIASAYWGE